MRKLRLREGEMQGGRAPGPQRLQRAWGGGSWGFPSLCWAWTVTLEQGWGQALSSEAPNLAFWPVARPSYGSSGERPGKRCAQQWLGVRALPPRQLPAWPGGLTDRQGL